ncbi:uncharacterized protein LOC115718395 isoform X1 [Cannabis sativa]|uniref:uncharacterized protein LOC115718395 isoform X1 n=2 Tax=Cannabis sativa TaxID=3483 RepID=UPI0029CA4241|nr:uncharacterized protein LOC115718395 isoform X1 [Cannabis sativa]
MSGLVSRTALRVVIGVLGIIFMATHQSPSPHIDGDDDDSSHPIISQRIRLKDGRFLAYKEKGVPKTRSNYKIIIVHGFGSSKDMNFLAPQDLVDELGIYFLLYDRAGYGESDPNPKHSVKSEALDIQELADQLQIGSKFYVIGVSMGSYPTWSCLKYIPERLSGVAFVVPIVNYKWPSFPRKLIKDDYRRKLVQCGVWMANYVPGLLYWLVTQKWLPTTSSVMNRKPVLFNSRDIDALKKTKGFPMLTPEKLQHKGVFDTLRGDFVVAYSEWGFDPMELRNPFPNENRSCVHIWQGYEDKVVPFELQRYVSSKLPWIKYHEVVDGGHLIVHYNGLCEAILRALLLGEESLEYRPNIPKEIVV